MRICFISSGTFEHIQPYIDYFKSNGHEVYFIALSPSPDRNVRTYNAWRGSAANYNLSTKKWRYFTSAILARKVIKNLKPDIVHAHYATSGGLAAYLSGHKNVLITAHGSDVNISVNSILWRFFLKLFFKKAKRIIAVSDELVQRIERLGVPKNKIANLNVGINFHQFYSQRFLNVIPIIVVCNRSFKPIYGHETIVKALLNLKEENILFKMHFIGDGEIKDEIQRLCDDNGLSSSVTFHGRIANEMQSELFKGYFIYVSASISDGTSLSLLEAMASGLFPIVTDIPANKTLLKENAFFFPKEDYIELANCFRKASDPSFLNKVKHSIQANQLTVKSVGDRVENMKILKDIYFEITGSNPMKITK